MKKFYRIVSGKFKGVIGFNCKPYAKTWFDLIVTNRPNSGLGMVIDVKRSLLKAI